MMKHTMMKRTHSLNRVIALLLVLVMLTTIMPMNALASVKDLADNTAEENRRILDQLSGMKGGEYDEIFAMLDAIGMLDENGELKTDHTIDMDGVSYTLEEVMAMLDDPATNLGRISYVDGLPIALGDLKTIIEIEMELARLQTTYFSGRAFSPEQLADMESLLNQVESEGIRMSASPDIAAMSGTTLLSPMSVSTAPTIDLLPLNGAPKQISLNLSDGATGRLTYRYEIVVRNYDWTSVDSVVLNLKKALIPGVTAKFIYNENVISGGTTIPDDHDTMVLSIAYNGNHIVDTYNHLNPTSVLRNTLFGVPEDLLLEISVDRSVYRWDMSNPYVFTGSKKLYS